MECPLVSSLFPPPPADIPNSPRFAGLKQGALSSGGGGNRDVYRFRNLTYLIVFCLLNSDYPIVVG
jgi:hypothetical protein